MCALLGFPVGSFKLTLTHTREHREPGAAAPTFGFPEESIQRELDSYMTLCISLLSMLNVYAVPWSEFTIVPSYPHICSAMVGVPHRPLLPSYI